MMYSLLSSLPFMFPIHRALIHLFLHLFTSLNQLPAPSLCLRGWFGENPSEDIVVSTVKWRHLEECLAQGKYLVHVNNLISSTLNIWRIKSRYRTYYNAFTTLALSLPARQTLICFVSLDIPLHFLKFCIKRHQVTCAHFTSGFFHVA